MAVAVSWAVFELHADLESTLKDNHRRHNIIDGFAFVFNSVHFCPRRKHLSIDQPSQATTSSTRKARSQGSCSGTISKQGIELATLKPRDALFYLLSRPFCSHMELGIHFRV